MPLRWTWKYLVGSEPAVSVLAELTENESSFSTQSEAENWLGSHWRELHHRGVVSAWLCRDGNQFTDPISLSEGM